MRAVQTDVCQKAESFASTASLVKSSGLLASTTLLTSALQRGKKHRSTDGADGGTGDQHKGQEPFTRIRDLTMVWKSKKALAWRVNNPISVVVGAQLTRTSGKDFLPSLCSYSYDRTINLGAFSGNSTRFL